MTEEERWKEEWKEWWDTKYPSMASWNDTGSIEKGYSQEGYLQACRKRQGDKIIFEVAFAPDGKFSGIVVGDCLIDEGETK